MDPTVRESTDTVVLSETDPLDALILYLPGLSGWYPPFPLPCDVIEPPVTLQFTSTDVVSPVLVTPTAIDTTQFSPAQLLGPAVELGIQYGGTSGRFAVAEYGARLFPALLTDFIARVKSENLVPDSEFDPRQFAHDSVTPLGHSVAAFTTPPGEHGLGTAELLAPSTTPIQGVAVLEPDSMEPDLTILRVRLDVGEEKVEALILQLNRRCMEAGETCWGPW